MEVEAQSNSVPKRSHKCFFISILAVCVIIVVSIGVYYILNHENSQYDEDLDDETPETEKWVKNEEIRRFRKYLQFRTISLHGQFESCTRFLREQADDLDLENSVHYPVNDDNPVVVMTWKGSEPDLPSILLNSHMDVVPVAAEYWHYLPFAADIDKNGNIYARGTQDMKSVGMQYLGAIRALKRKGITQLKRTIHLTYMPDEETGGHFGMAPFVKSDFFKNMNVGFGLDEGYPSPDDNLEVFYAEKSNWAVTVTANGHSGHGSILFDDTAGEKLNYIVNKFMEYRRNELKKWKEGNYPYGNVTSINLTTLKGGLRGNVVPPEFSAHFDIRLAINADWDALERTINRWTKEAGGNVTVDIYKGLKAPPTTIDSTNPYWVAFKKATDELHLNVTPAAFRAGTDSRYIRDLHISALGFTPLMNTPPLLHEHDEYVNADVYLNGIAIYEKIIETIGNLE